jgi:hypothetical protein
LAGVEELIFGHTSRQDRHQLSLTFICFLRFVCGHVPPQLLAGEQACAPRPSRSFSPMLAWFSEKHFLTYPA